MIFHHSLTCLTASHPSTYAPSNDFGILLPDHEADPERELHGECSGAGKPPPVSSNSLLESAPLAQRPGSAVGKSREERNTVMSSAVSPLRR